MISHSAPAFSISLNPSDCHQRQIERCIFCFLPHVRTSWLTVARVSVEEDFSKFLMSETGAGSECAAGHVDDLAALRFPHFHLIPCFTEEGIRRPCRAWLDGNAQVHEKSFDLGKGFGSSSMKWEAGM